ncbi:chaplin family protein [Actinoallomurus rhizosphaericola]|uniref:chaplin family protein n=1 Tax=Actinoallomurus rhizosphaericola TaxID=2952536 RepID=UPI002093ED88|nr:chaplin family protein [Actinoallomurus rhizosphaericola]MCO5995797.1 DUF320 domain-containing protein [Actinoallomurus rhizosphaericola]
MPTWAKSTARATLLTASFVALGAGPALADVTNGSGSVLGGNQVKAPVSAPVNVSGNAVAVIGHALAGSTGGASVHRVGGVGGGRQSTSGRHSIGGGNQVDAPITAPVNVCGNAVAVIGRSAAGCEGGASVSGGYGSGHRGRTTGAGSVLGGNQVNIPITAPINICGNAVAVIGDALAGCKGGAAVKSGGHGHGRSGAGSTSGRHSIGGGNQVTAPITAPINVCGNAVGNALAGCEGGASVTGHGTSAGGGRTNGRHSILGGNQVTAPITAPVDICGNAVAVIGGAAAGCAGVIPPVHGGSASGGRTNGRHSIGGGNQVTAPITAPINVCGNAVAVIGHALAGCVGGASVSGGHGGHGGHGGGHHCVSPQHATAARTMSAPASAAIPGAPRPPAPVPVPPLPPVPPVPVPPLPQNAALAAYDGPAAPADAIPVLPGTTLPGTTGLGDAVNVPQSGSDTSETAAGTERTGAPVGSGVADTVPGARALPNLPNAPITRSVPAADAVLPLPARQGLPPVGEPVKGIPAMRTVAAQEPAQAQRGAVAALALAALLAASSGVVAMVRRFRDR